jgi:hypothetical protein
MRLFGNQPVVGAQQPFVNALHVRQERRLGRSGGVVSRCGFAHNLRQKACTQRVARAVGVHDVGGVDGQRGDVQRRGLRGFIHDAAAVLQVRW